LPPLLQSAAISARGLGEAFFPPVASAVAAFAVATGLTSLTVPPLGPDFLPAAMWGTVFFLSYALTLRLLFTDQLRQLVGYLPARAPISRVLLLTPR
jgi:hypothetical protein